MNSLDLECVHFSAARRDESQRETRENKENEGSSTRMEEEKKLYDMMK